RISAEPLTAYICHCHRCQKRTGSAFAMFVVLPAEGFHLEGGTPEVVVMPGAKSRSWICCDCRSRLYSEADGYDGAALILLRAGTLDDTRTLRPAAQMWTESGQEWAIVRDDILSYAQQPDDFGPMRKAWQALRTSR
ncbi:MAG: GFA family protein, partial [Alphaproteobacteria bacterium]|nr:GFA family protein [Alphaproteobacteria bacterium]